MKRSKIIFVSILLAAMPAFAQEVKYKTADGLLGWKTDTTTGRQNLGPSGTWWRNQNYITLLTLTPDQQKRMDDVFQQTRIRLIDLKAILDKEEAILEPLIEADRLDETRAAPQIDKVADARAALEKANARMLLSIRQILTPEQWTKLSSSKGGSYAGTIEAYKDALKNREKVLKNKE
jgi:Spy/CpxP family protein refolding chaperone